MRAVSVSDELKQLSVITEQCAARALIAKQQAQKYAQHYRARAEEFRKQAACSRFPEIQARLLRIAVRDIAEGTACKAEVVGTAEPWEPVRLSPQAAINRTEDPVSQARRHVDEAAARIERQEALVARLSYSGKYLSLTGQAREILGTLQQTLQLARDHLEYELRK